MSDSLVIIPTYNEIENIEAIIRAVFYLKTDFHVLIVDDNATNRQILTLQAQSWRAISHGVKSGEKALELMSTGIKLDLAILDMQMPGMDGLTLARAIRQQWSH